MLKSVIKEWITTLLGLVLLVFMGINLWDVSKGIQEFDWVFTSALTVGGLFLLISTDKWIKTTLNKVVGKVTDKVE